MLKKTGILLTSIILMMSMTISPVFAGTEKADPQVTEKAADSWRFDEGALNEDADKNLYKGEAATMGSNAGGCTVAWSKLNGEFYNSKGDIIPGAYRKGIDVSSWQKDIDWAKVKNSSDIDFVIIRCGYGSDKTKYDDKKWLRNVQACEQYGIPYGVYIYSYAESLNDAKSEANHVLRLLKGHKPDYPVYYDLEDKTVKKKGKANIELYARTFCSMIENAGYEAGIYASLTWWRKYLDSTEFDQYDKWIAQWTTGCTYERNFRLWQCTSGGSVPGIKGRIDINFDFSPAGPSTGVAQTNGGYQAVAIENVNFRTGPGTKYTKKGTYKKGTYVNIVSVDSNGWGKLSNGYYLKVEYTSKVKNNGNESAVAGSSDYKVITTENLNYRTGPGTKYKKKGTYKKGTTITIKSVENGWGKLSNGYYVYLKYTKKM